MAHSVKNQGSRLHARSTTDIVRDLDSLALSADLRSASETEQPLKTGAASQFDEVVFQSLIAGAEVKSNAR